jgi:hypothetical protein
MQHVDRPTDVQTLPQPARQRCPRVQVESVGLVACSEGVHGISAHFRWRRDVRQRPAVRPAESKLAIRLSIELVALFVDGAVMPATEQREIRERRGPSVGPVTDVVALAEPNPAARETAAAVAMVEGPP